MSLMICPECGKEVSDRAESCPNCGCPIIDNSVIASDTEESENRNDSLQGILSIVFGILGILFAFISGGTVTLISIIFFIISGILGIKCNKNFSIIGILISGLGIASFLIDQLLPILFD